VGVRQSTVSGRSAPRPGDPHRDRAIRTATGRVPRSLRGQRPAPQRVVQHPNGYSAPGRSTLTRRDAPGSGGVQAHRVGAQPRRLLRCARRWGTRRWWPLLAEPPRVCSRAASWKESRCSSSRSCWWYMLRKKSGCMGSSCTTSGRGGWPLTTAVAGRAPYGRWDGRAVPRIQDPTGPSGFPPPGAPALGPDPRRPFGWNLTVLPSETRTKGWRSIPFGTNPLRGSAPAAREHRGSCPADAARLRPKGIP
jgi:hypothetical protein